MKELRITSLLLLSSLMILGCYYDVEEEIYPTADCLTVEMSYRNDIQPILASECYTCHSAAANFANITLEGFDEMNKYVADGSLIGAIRHDAGFSPMPKNKAMLLQCEIEKIEAWIADGALNN